ncbi:MAG: asparagine synthase (glutamine-hydrolyzing) [Pseudomonadota bacterium]|nr:asparagine synthase (glutamine-hydrolyzing) [Pseudomonadota bacterium]
MCGIAGLIGNRRVKEQSVADMTRMLAHRGPDDSGLWTSDDGHAVLGHRRLSVLDTSSAGHQPMLRGDFVITYNGEIYNYIELAERLKSEGARITSECDTEVLLAAYEHWGPACLDELNGMFAFAILDTRRKVLFCARDRMGEKPFLFTASRDHFAFASEFKSLLALESISGDYDQTRLLRFLYRPSQGLDSDLETLFDGISQLPAAHALTLNLENLEHRIERYWDIAPDADLATLGEQEAQKRFRDLLINAINIRMRSDVAQGSCLSGGLDSTTIVCAARRLLGPDSTYDTFSGIFPGSDADEETWARIAANTAATRCHWTEPSVEGFLEDLPEFMWYNELPVGSASQYAQWCVFRLAKANDITVLLDGQGADELLGGYEQYFEAYLAERGNQDGERAKIEARYPMALAKPDQKLKSMLPNSLRHLASRIIGTGSDFSFGLKPAAARVLYAALPTGSHGAEKFRPLTAALYTDYCHHHLPVLLRYGDRNSMAHSREVRLPFCDHRLAEFVLSLSAGTLMGGAQTKRLLRGAFREELPIQIRERWNKQGFLPPASLWFQGRLGTHLRDIIHERAFAESDIWNAGWWRRALDRFEGGESHLADVLWRPLVENAWHTYFLKRARDLPKLPLFAASS